MKTANDHRETVFATYRAKAEAEVALHRATERLGEIETRHPDYSFVWDKFIAANDKCHDAKNAYAAALNARQEYFNFLQTQLINFWSDTEPTK